MIDLELEAAYARCQRLARTHYENFPVASYLLPAPMRPHIAAIYAFARTADDFADDAGRSNHERLRLLNDWGARLDRAATVATRDAPAESGPTAAATVSPDPADADAIFLALADTIRARRLPVSLFHDLLSAFKQDVLQTRYDTWQDVLDYCRRSANPVGRLVLRVAGYDTPALDARADAMCTALQLTNFWQDLERDWRIGRIYVPLADRVRFGAREQDLADARMTPAWQSVMAEMTARTRGLFEAGRSVCDDVHGRLRWELRLTWLAASRILDRLEAVGFDVFTRRPSLTAADAPGVLLALAAWRSRRPYANSRAPRSSASR